ncbi:hypothetical protein GQ44DRAFT_376871 [Phaeosphaeriaceae sp. PMI808]|nr:hypothetical protein GQ44DRAFT_376871 [Phaeosphaeriaceae sp. PMI808]
MAPNSNRPSPPREGNNTEKINVFETMRFPNKSENPQPARRADVSGFRPGSEDEQEQASIENNWPEADLKERKTSRVKISPENDYTAGQSESYERQEDFEPVNQQTGDEEARKSLRNKSDEETEDEEDGTTSNSERLCACYHPKTQRPLDRTECIGCKFKRAAHRFVSETIMTKCNRCNLRYGHVWWRCEYCRAKEVRPPSADERRVQEVWCNFGQHEAPREQFLKEDGETEMLLVCKGCRLPFHKSFKGRPIDY